MRRTAQRRCDLSLSEVKVRQRPVLCLAGEPEVREVIADVGHHVRLRGDQVLEGLDASGEVVGGRSAALRQATDFSQPLEIVSDDQCEHGQRRASWQHLEHFSSFTIGVWLQQALFAGRAAPDRRRGRPVVQHLGNQLAQLFLGRFQGGRALGGGPVVLPLLAARRSWCGPSDSRPFELVEHRVERARADVVAVPGELLHHLDAEDRLLDGVVQHVQPHEAPEEHLGQQLVHSCRTPILNININRRQGGPARMGWRERLGTGSVAPSKGRP